MRFDDRREAEITKSEFDEVQSANAGLQLLLALEEKLDLVLANYLEYERELLRLALDHLVWGASKWSTHRAARHAVNLRIINFLSTTRLYLDQVSHDLVALFGKDSAETQEVEAARRAEYDSSLAFRVLEALRNHVQHRAMAVHELAFPILLDSDAEPMTAQYSVVPFLHVAKLADDSSFKKSVLAELCESGPETSLTPLIRAYVASLGRIHTIVRRLTKRSLSRWEQVIDRMIKRAHEVFGDDLSLLAISVEIPNNPVVASYLVHQVSSELRAFRSRSTRRDDLDLRYVASEPPRVARKRRKPHSPTG